MKRKRPEIGDEVCFTGRVAEIHETPNGIHVAFLPEVEDDICYKDTGCDEAACETEKCPQSLGVSAAVFADAAAVVQAFIAVMRTPQGQALIAALLKLAADFGIKQPQG